MQLLVDPGAGTSWGHRHQRAGHRGERRGRSNVFPDYCMQGQLKGLVINVVACGASAAAARNPAREHQLLQGVVQLSCALAAGRACVRPKLVGARK